jgi:predicted DsbA family dithiol-disulfide isomerase
VKVEIWSDVVCPFCYIGKRQFEEALARFEHAEDVEVVWRSFELDPGAPAERTRDNLEHLATKYGMSRADAQAAQDRVQASAARVDLYLDFERTRGGNTFDAHRLVHLAAEHGLQDEMEERLFAAYFTEGRPVGLADTVRSVAIEAGLPADEVDAVLASDRFADDVRADERDARALGISGVPFFVIDRAFGVSGAQGAETILEALDHAWTAAHPLTIVGSAGSGASDASCDDGSCAV